jgi:perosamine synthetase
VLSPLTCKVVPLALLSAGVRPIYADISAATLNLDATAAATAITPRTRAVLFQHTYGNLAGAQAIKTMTSDRGVLLVEDCAHCVPVLADDYTPGRWGSASIFSNNPMKPLPTGSGGFAAIHDRALAEGVRNCQTKYPYRSNASEWLRKGDAFLRRQALRPSLYWPLFELSRAVSHRQHSLSAEIASEITALGYRISERQATDGDVGLARLDEIVGRRRAACATYREALEGVDGVDLPKVNPQFPLLYFPILSLDKTTLLRRARARAIPIVPWPIRTPIYPIEDERALSQYGYELGSCPVAEDVARRLVGLPTDSSIPLRHDSRVIALVKAVRHAR